MQKRDGQPQHAVKLEECGHMLRRLYIAGGTDAVLESDWLAAADRSIWIGAASLGGAVSEWSTGIKLVRRSWLLLIKQVYHQNQPQFLSDHQSLLRYLYVGNQHLDFICFRFRLPVEYFLTRLFHHNKSFKS